MELPNSEESFIIHLQEKVLKSPNTETSYISDLMNRLAASHPHISFKFINNNRLNFTPQAMVISKI